jgi:hypothetical protein
MRFARIAAVLTACVAVTGCGLVAAPCRVASAAIKIVPVVGHPAAVPTDACAEAIDP